MDDETFFASCTDSRYPCATRAAPGYVVDPTTATCVPPNTVAACLPTVTCAALPNPGAAWNSSACTALPAGGSCVVRCATGYAVRPSQNATATRTCPSMNTAGSTLPTGDDPYPLCEPIVGCADSWPPLVQGCGAMRAGNVCQAGCQPGYAATLDADGNSILTSTYTCPESNVLATTQPIGTGPSCAAIVGCAPLPDQGAAFDEGNCASVAAGDECTLSCAIGWVTVLPATYRCPPLTTSVQTVPIAIGATILPTCTRIVPCAGPSNLGTAFTVSCNAASTANNAVTAGHSCSVTCAAGYVGTGTVLLCPPQNTDPTSELTGALPTCTPTVRCAALTIQQIYNTSQCVNVQPGQTCPVTCSHNHVGGVGFFNCPTTNQDPLRQPSGILPTCVPIVPCLDPRLKYDARSGNFVARLSASQSIYPGSSVVLSPGHDVSACVPQPCPASGNGQPPACLPSGRSCTVTCMPGYAGGTGSLMCPTLNTQRYLAPQGTLPTCRLVVPCHALDDQGPQFFERDCTRVSAGGNCTVGCATGYVGGASLFRCPGDNVDGQPRGLLPACTALQPCAALSNQGTQYDLSDCASMAAGDKCNVVCAPGFSGAVASFLCPTGNVNTITMPQGTLPSCRPIVDCASLANQGAPFNESLCGSVTAGGSCLVTCSTGYTGVGSKYGCSPSNTNTSTQPVGTLPTCTALVGCGPVVLAAQDAIGRDASPCASTSAGQSCLLRCASGYVGQATVYTCPALNVNASIAPTGTLPICVPIVACAPLGSPGSAGPPGISAALNLSACSNVPAGGSCLVTCAPGYVGSTARLNCPSANTNAIRAPMPTSNLPTCAPIVGCAPLLLPTQYDATSCANVPAGSSCTVSCGAGYIGGSSQPCADDPGHGPGDLGYGIRGYTCASAIAEFGCGTFYHYQNIADFCPLSCGRCTAQGSFSCSATNTLTTTQPFGTLPRCTRLQACNGFSILSVSSQYVSNCSNVSAGHDCIVSCAPGYSGGSKTFTCSASNTNAAASPTGMWPVCSQINGCAPLHATHNGVTFSSTGCHSLAAGDSCLVSCPSGYNGTAVNFSCPALLTNHETQPIALAYPACSKIFRCAALDISGPVAFDTRACTSVAAGSSCIVSCAPGYVGTTSTYACPAQNTIAATHPSGVPPICAAIVGCAALGNLGTAFQTASCASVA
eukprot:COSAG01_NODE_6658_length_3560_cov_2.825195_1_plen_1176_part_01